MTQSSARRRTHATYRYRSLHHATTTLMSSASILQLQRRVQYLEEQAGKSRARLQHLEKEARRANAAISDLAAGIMEAIMEAWIDRLEDPPKQEREQRSARAGRDSRPRTGERSANNVTGRSSRAGRDSRSRTRERSATTSTSTSTSIGRSSRAGRDPRSRTRERGTEKPLAKRPRQADRVKTETDRMPEDADSSPQDFAPRYRPDDPWAACVHCGCYRQFAGMTAECCYIIRGSPCGPWRPAPEGGQGLSISF